MEMAVAHTPAELERSGPVFGRARRLAGALFGCDASYADVFFVGDGQIWRDPAKKIPVAASGSQWVVENGELLWVDDAHIHPQLAGLAVKYGMAYLRLYVAAPIRLEDGSIPGVLVVGAPEPKPYDPDLAARLQDLADLGADEWTRLRVTRARDPAPGTLAALVQSAPLALALTDRDMRVLHASPSWLDQYAVDDAQPAGRTLYEVAPAAITPWRP